MTIFRTAAVTALLFMMAAATGCARSPQVNFYTLDAMAPQAPSPAPNPLAVAVGPVTLPELVDRPQLVLRVDPNRVEIMETERWAEPLKSAIPRLLAENLSRLLHPARVATIDQVEGRHAEYHVSVDIQRFETIPGEGVRIEALWSVRRAAFGAVPLNGSSQVEEKAGDSSRSALIAAHGRALAAISNDIARALREEVH